MVWHRSIAPLFAAVLIVGVVMPAAPARADGVFEFGKIKATRIVVTAGDTYPAEPIDDSPMLLSLQGGVADLNSKEAVVLGQAVLPGGKLVDARGVLFRVGIAHVYAAGPNKRKRVEILLTPDGVVLAQELDDDEGKPTSSGRVVKLDSEKYRQLSIGWSRYRGSFGEGFVGLSESSAAKRGEPAATLSLGAVAPLAAPIVPSPFYLDQKLLGERFLGGRRSNISAADRTLAQEKMFLRVPLRYDPKQPVGLLVWISAMSEGRPPGVFSQALDELNIACIGIENVGNDRPVANRYQLALDAIFAASARVHVDPRRVYVTGISGGGRVSSMLEACFPDYFTGSLPIVGLSCYERVPLGNSRYAPAGYTRPTDKRFTLFKSRRMGVVTGGKDFNEPEIVAAASIMKGDGIAIRVFNDKDMGHELPSASNFLDAMKWVDEPYQAIVEKEREMADGTLEKYIKKHGETPPSDKAARAELVKVTNVGPWTPAAWRAVEMLKKATP